MDDLGRVLPMTSREKCHWTDEENRIMISNIQRHGTQWDLVAAQLPGRTADAVRNHCHRLQTSSVCWEQGLWSLSSDGTWTEDRKTGSAHDRSVWTAEEDRIICEGYEVFGCKWRRIGAKLPGRSDSSVRNRWTRICDGPSHAAHLHSAVTSSTSVGGSAVDVIALPARETARVRVHASARPRFEAVATRVLVVKPSAPAGQIGRDPLAARINDPLGAAAAQSAAYYPFGPQLDPATDFGCFQVQQSLQHQMHQMHQVQQHQAQQHQMHQMHLGKMHQMHQMQQNQHLWAMQHQQMQQQPQHLQPAPQQCTLLPWPVKNGAIPTTATPLTTTTTTPGALRPGSHFRVVPY